MKNLVKYLNANKYVKFLFITITSSLIIASLITKNILFDKLSIYTLSLFYIFCLIDTFLIGMKYRRNKVFLKSIDFTLTYFQLGIIIIIGFFLGLTDYNEYYKYYWMITVGYYALHAGVYSYTTDIPVKMTYGGWKQLKL